MIMASSTLYCSIALLAFLSLPNHLACFSPKHLNLSAAVTEWATAHATWYGPPNGAGSDGTIHLNYVN